MPLIARHLRWLARKFATLCRKRRMARDQIDMTPIANRDELVRWFEAGCKPKSDFRIGT